MEFQYESHPLRTFTYNLQQIIGRHRNNKNNKFEQDVRPFVHDTTGAECTLLEYWDQILQNKLPTSAACNPKQMMKVHLVENILDKAISTLDRGWWSRMWADKLEFATYTALVELSAKKLLDQAKDLEKKAELEERRALQTKAAASSNQPAEQHSQGPARSAVHQGPYDNNDDNVSTGTVSTILTVDSLTGGRVRAKRSNNVDAETRTLVANALAARVMSDEERFNLLGSLLSASLKVKDQTSNNVYNDLAIAIILSPEMTLNAIIKTHPLVVSAIKGEANRKILDKYVNAPSNPDLETKHATAWKNVLMSKRSAGEVGLPENVGLAMACANWYYSQEFSDAMRIKTPKFADAIDKRRIELLSKLANGNAPAPANAARATAGTAATTATSSTGATNSSPAFFGTGNVTKTTVGTAAATATPSAGVATSTAATAPNTGATMSTTTTSAPPIPSMDW